MGGRTDEPPIGEDLSRLYHDSVETTNGKGKVVHLVSLKLFIASAQMPKQRRLMFGTEKAEIYGTLSPFSGRGNEAACKAYPKHITEKRIHNPADENTKRRSVLGRNIIPMLSSIQHQDTLLRPLINKCIQHDPIRVHNPIILSVYVQPHSSIELYGNHRPYRYIVDLFVLDDPEIRKGIGGRIAVIGKPFMNKIIVIIRIVALYIAFKCKEPILVITISEVDIIFFSLLRRYASTRF